MRPLDQAKAGQILRALQTKDYSHGESEHGVDDRVDTANRRTDDIVELLEIICRAHGVSP
jgi:hypothetical protein